MRNSSARLVGAALLCVAWQPLRALDWREPWQVPHDPAAAARASDEFAWRLFIALIWPADRATGAADRRAALGDARPSVWERWENSADVYRDDGADPGAWGASTEPDIAAASHRFESLSRAEFPNARHIVAGRMQPLLDPLQSAARLVEIRMNRVAFEYIRKAGLYNVEGQLARVSANVPVEFPGGAIEVKASWRPIGAADRRRYHSLAVRFADGTTRLYGLTALNIAAKELPHWFWASFEHIDNAARPGGEGWRLPSRDRFACAGDSAGCDRAPPIAGLDHAVWSLYRLRGTMTRYVDAVGAPERLGNSELEAGLQESASCMTCHSRAALAVHEGAPRRLEIFDSRAAAAPLRRGYIGEPDPAWFRTAAADGHDALEFQPLDFVWSLAQAKPRRDRAIGTGRELQ